jgi:hypothetical protein
MTSQVRARAYSATPSPPLIDLDVSRQELFYELINDQQSMVTSSAISTLCQPRNFSAVAWRNISHPRHFS